MADCTFRKPGLPLKYKLKTIEEKVCQQLPKTLEQKGFQKSFTNQIHKARQ